MPIFEVETTIAAPPARVWDVLADIGTIHVWNPGVKHSRTTTNTGAGLGAGRHCDLGGTSYLKEEVVAWEPGQRLTMRVVETNLPFESADIRFTLHADGQGTRVVVSPEYHIRYGWLGRVLDRLFVSRTYKRGMTSLLRGLKRHVEGGAAAA